MSVCLSVSLSMTNYMYTYMCIHSIYMYTYVLHCPSINCLRLQSLHRYVYLVTVYMYMYTCLLIRPHTTVCSALCTQVQYTTLCTANVLAHTCIQVHVLQMYTHIYMYMCTCTYVSTVHCTLYGATLWGATELSAVVTSTLYTAYRST